MKREQFDTLQSLLEMKFRESQRSFSKVVTAENRLRRELAKLDGMAKNAEEAQHQNMRAIGADVIWKAWVGRTKTGLNMELAHVLAQKERLARGVRKDYGKLLASQTIVGARHTEQTKRKQSEQLADVLRQHLIDQSLNLR